MTRLASALAAVLLAALASESAHGQRHVASVENALRLTGGDDHGNAPSSATPVALPSTTDGRIDTHDDVDYFRFEVSDTQPVSIGTGGSLDTLGTLYDGDGGVLDWNYTGNGFSFTHILSAGTYYVGVVSNGPTGAYTLFLGVEDATLVALPSTTGGRIETPGAPGEVDYFRFEVSDTQPVSIGTSGSLDTLGWLYDGDGGYLKGDNNDGPGLNFRIRRILSAGTYYVGVESYDGLTGAYTLLLEVQDATPVALPSRTDGRIDTRDDVDYFRFEVSDAQPVSIGTGGSLDTSGTLYDGDGGLLEWKRDDGPGLNFRIRRILSAGTYYVGVESHDDSTGAYTLLLGVEDATPVALPSTTGGRIETPGDVDYFRFEVSDTQQVTIETSGNTNTRGRLFGRSCVSLPRACDDLDGGSGSNFSIQISLQAGTYYVRVESDGVFRDPLESRVGAYTLRLAVGDDHGNAPSEATPVTLPGERNGWIQTASDVDYFQFEISDPHRVFINTSWFLGSRTRVQPLPRIALYAGDGRLLESNDNGGFDSSIERGLSAGMYYIRVATNDGSTGRYVLSLWWDDHGNTLSSATRVALPSTTAEYITAGDVDYFRFEVTRTQWVSITTSGDDFFHTNGILYDGDGSALESAFDSHWCGSGFSFTLNLSPGTYYVLITPDRGGETGAYTLRLALSRTACDDDHGDTRSSATRVGLPSTTTGQLEDYYDQDWFRFEVAHEQRVSISILSNFLPTVYFSDADGNHSASTWDDLLPWPYLISMRTLSAGTYYVSVDSSGVHSGEYALRLEVAPLYADELRLPLDALAPDAPGELRWTAAYSSDESMASVRIEGGELVVEPAYAAEGLVRIEATATDSDGGTVTAIFDVQVEFYSPGRLGAGWRSAVLFD